MKLPKLIVASGRPVDAWLEAVATKTVAAMTVKEVEKCILLSFDDFALLRR